MVEKKIGYLEAVSIGIGGMIGGGIFAVLGLTVLLAKGAAPIAFLIAGLIALVTAYSYAKLSVRFPSEGGTIEFIVRAFGTGVIPAWLNTLLLGSYIIMLSLYSYAFGSYGAVLILGVENILVKKLLTAAVIILFTVLNLMGAYIVGKAEDYMVAFKVFILLFFSVLGFMTIDPSRLSPSHYPHFLHVFAGGLIIFLAYEGFELIANTAADVKDPDKTLPKAFYTAVIFVILIYMLVALVAVGNLDYQEVVKAQDYVLAEAAKPFLGDAGFILISIAALVSTASAINATLYGTARISYMVAKFGELPQVFAKRIWKGAYEGLIILAALTVIAALSFNLENISVAGSLGFLMVFGAVNLANFKLAEHTKSSRFISGLGFVACLVAVVVLFGHNLKTSPDSLKSSVIVILATLVFEVIYRFVTKRKLSEFIDWRLREKEEFLDNFEKYLGPILHAIRTHLKGAEVYILDDLARGERKGANKLHLGVTVSRKLSKDEMEQQEQKIKEAAGLKEHHPLKISFVTTDEKDKLLEHSPRRLADEQK
ncbi:MAG: APC family permease [Thermodesulfobacteria bacterium]|nr:APC family permease [Thermodesulfobacteriota bacterium]